MMHISDRIAAELGVNGWEMRARASHRDTLFTKRIEAFAEAGTCSDGARVVNLSIDESGRWLERHDGWGKVEREVDLRNFIDNAKGAIAAALA